MTFYLTITAALASALMGGVFFAFSSFIMPALGRIPPVEGIRAMQRINLDVFHWSFMVVFFGMPIITVMLAVQGMWNWPNPEAILSTVGSAVYLIGCLLVTGVGNVPRNKALAKINADNADAESVWKSYSIGWTKWNHVRTAACMAAASAFLATLVVT